MAGANTTCTSCGTELEIPRPVAPSGSSTSGSGPWKTAGTGSSSAGTADNRPVIEEAVADEPPVHFRKDKTLPKGELDMTPMVDVTFLLLIFFMVTASFSIQKSLELPAPKSDSPSTSAKTIDDYLDDPDFITVRIDSFDTFHVTCAAWDDEREAPSKQELFVKLREAKNSNPSGVPPRMLMVNAHVDATHDKVVIAIDAGSEVGMDSIRFVTTEED